MLTISPQLPHLINDKVGDYLVNMVWNFPQEAFHFFPGIRSWMAHIVIPEYNQPDQLVWSSLDNGDLFLKDAYNFKISKGNINTWYKHVFYKDIPPLKVIIFLKLIHDKTTTNDNLKLRDWP